METAQEKIPRSFSSAGAGKEWVTVFNSIVPIDIEVMEGRYCERHVYSNNEAQRPRPVPNQDFFIWSPTRLSIG